MDERFLFLTNCMRVFDFCVWFTCVFCKYLFEWTCHAHPNSWRLLVFALKKPWQNCLLNETLKQNKESFLGSAGRGGVLLQNYERSESPAFAISFEDGQHLLCEFKHLVVEEIVSITSSRNLSDAWLSIVSSFRRSILCSTFSKSHSCSFWESFCDLWIATWIWTLRQLFFVCGVGEKGQLSVAFELINCRLQKVQLLQTQFQNFELVRSILAVLACQVALGVPFTKMFKTAKKPERTRVLRKSESMWGWWDTFIWMKKIDPTFLKNGVLCAFFVLNPARNFV